MVDPTGVRRDVDHQDIIFLDPFRAEFEELINEFLTPTEIKKWRNNLVKLRKEIDDSNESYYKRIYIEM